MIRCLEIIWKDRNLAEMTRFEEIPRVHRKDKEHINGYEHSLW